MAAWKLLSRAALAVATVSLSGVGAFDWPWGVPGSKTHAVDELDADNFKKFLEEHSVTAIMFYAPWCFYSQQMMPAWDTAAQKLLLHDPPIHLAKIDSHHFGSIGDEYQVSSYPTMKLFVDGAVFEYEARQGRGWQQIVKWVNRHIDRDHILKKVEDVDHYLHDNDLNVVGLFTDGHNTSTFAKSASHFDDVFFAEAQGTEISAQIGERLAKHAMLTCETISLGQSSGPGKQADLPREGMQCEDQPRNPQRADWTDTFHAVVIGKKVMVNRTDSPDSGWQQLLALKCCDDETKLDKTKQIKITAPALVMFMPHDERYAIYDGDVEDMHAMDKWISARRTPMIMRMTPETADKIMETGPEKLPVLFFLTQHEDPKVEGLLKEAATELRGRIQVVLSGPGGSQVERRLAEIAGAEDDALPVLTIIEVHGGGGPFHTAKKYRIPVKGLTVASVKSFVGDYEAGQLTPWMKSEPEPPPEDGHRPGAVGMLVGTTFKKTVEDTTKDVLVDFYAPWCGHCRKFEPALKLLAKNLKHVRTLKVFKLDATRNEVEGMTIMGFPTIVLFPAGEPPTEQHHYQGNRSPEDLNRWLHDVCTHQFDDRPPKEEVKAEPVESGLLDPSEEDL